MDSNKINFKEKQWSHYRNLDHIYCPALKSLVKFNSDGFYHMINKTNRRKRTARAQHSRLALIPLIKPTIKLAKKINETRIEKKKMLNGQKIITCYALIARVGKDLCPIKVIIRKISNGSYFFHSIMRLNTKKHPD